MGFDITIKKAPKKPLVIPKEAGYVPPNPDDPGYLRFSGSAISLLVDLMSAARILDKRAATYDLAEKCKDGKIPAYKFNFNDGERIAPEECAAIAAALEKQEISSTDFIAKIEKQSKRPLVPKARPALPELMKVWITYNKICRGG